MTRTILALGLAVALPVLGAAPDDARYRELDARIKALETQAQELRAQAAQALEAAQAARAELEQARAQQPAPVAVASAPAAAGNAFNPAISMILNGVYAHHSLEPDDYTRAGFPQVGEGGPLPQGFSLGETEISLAANVDDKFYGQATIALGIEDGDTEVNVEEAYLDTLGLPSGFTLRMGRFFSNIGYLNSHHAHTDNFADRPLPYQAFLGNQYGDDGVQLRFVAPLDFYLELGAELMRGDAFPAGGAAHGGIGARSFFAHAGGDVGVENSWLAGISYLRTRAEDAADGFRGDEDLYLADLTWKWAPNGNTKDGGVTVRGEYFYEDRDGEPAYDTRRGAYLEGIWRLNRIWDAGYRYDALWGDDASHDPRRHSLMLTWRNSEFALVRLQISHDEPRQDRDDNAVYLQYQASLGAHGAHKF